MVPLVFSSLMTSLTSSISGPRPLRSLLTDFLVFLPRSTTMVSRMGLVAGAGVLADSGVTVAGPFLNAGLRDQTRGHQMTRSGRIFLKPSRAALKTFGPMSISQPSRFLRLESLNRFWYLF